jgi:hypothetical protein
MEREGCIAERSRRWNANVGERDRTKRERAGDWEESEEGHVIGKMAHGEDAEKECCVAERSLVVGC